MEPDKFVDDDAEHITFGNSDELEQAEQELAQAEKERERLQQQLDETEGWDDVDPDAVKAFIAGAE